MQPVTHHFPAVGNATVPSNVRAGRSVEQNTVSADSQSFDTVLLSPQAQALVDEASAGPGKSGQSPAHEARQILALDPDQGGKPFGRIVSQVARGLLSLVDVAAAANPVTGAEEEAPDTPADTAADSAAGSGVEDTASTATPAGSGEASIDPEAAVAAALSGFLSDEPGTVV